MKLHEFYQKYSNIKLKNRGPVLNYLFEALKEEEKNIKKSEVAIEELLKIADKIIK
jgi:hypothetical protein